MKKILLLTMVLLLSISCGNKQNDKHDKGPRHGMSMQLNKDDDTAFVALKETVVPTFKQFAYKDKSTGKSMQYNLFIPDGWEKKNYPLVLFIADASTAGKEVTAPLTQGYGALLFASPEDQDRHPSFVLVPQFSETAVDDEVRRLVGAAHRAELEVVQRHGRARGLDGEHGYFRVRH